MEFAAIIPARYASTRFPAKPLAVLGGKPVVIRVCEQAKKVFDHVFVATDDVRIFDAVKQSGFIPIMTREDHKSGTDRCYEAFMKCGVKVDVVVNIQGDEPFIQPSQLQTIKSLFDSKDTDIATLVKPFAPDTPFEKLANPNSPVAKPHFHEYPEILGFYGSDPYNPWDLGGEVEFWVGGEQHILTKSTMVFLPPNVPHCPLLINRVDRPIFHYSVVMNAIYGFEGQGASFRAE